MFSRFFRWLEKNRASMLANLFMVIVGAWIIQWIVQWFAGSSENYYIFGFNPFSVTIYLGLFVFAFILFISPFDIRSSDEKINQELASQFSAEQAEILRKIVRAKDDELRTELRRKAFAIRQEYESLLGESLRDKDGNPFTDWREYLLAAHKRLTKEEQRLQARNRSNLRIGIGMAFLGVILLASYLYYLLFLGGSGTGNDFWTFLINYLPSFSIIIILGTLAVFFLRLYSSNERRLERNKSVLTNIELRLTAGLMLYDEKDKANFAILADNISKEDSNFVLGKNESSAGISTERLIEIITKAGLK